MGSVKDLEVIKKPTEGALGVGRFLFSDRYSVFDWGEMPDHIPYKGEAIALLGAFFFEELEARGIPTHYLGLVQDGQAKKLSDIERPVNAMEIKMVRVLGSDYFRYQRERGGFLIPLEVIYRNSLPAGSSVFRRLEGGELKPEDLALDAGGILNPGQRLSPPFIDFSTKLEATDRYLGSEEAREIAGLSDGEMAEMRRITDEVNTIITEKFSRIGLVNEDGKMEFGFTPHRRFMVVDVVGTLDECRFTFGGLPVSKEIARIHYRKTDWYLELGKAKEKGENWREFCPPPPPSLPEKLKFAISEVYCACTNEITGRRWFDVPPLGEVLGELK